jgi:hypothetical protein
MDTNNKSRILLSLILILSLGTVVVYSAITLGTISQEGSVLETVNATLGVIPQVYDKDATHWQLSLYWYNGTQYNKDDVLVMYYAHIDWTNPTGDTYIEPNA